MRSEVDTPPIAAAAMAVRTALTTGALVLLAGLGIIGGNNYDAEPPADPSLGLAGERGQLFAEHRCSATGFDETVIPGEAVIRHEDGRIELVTFERGWAAFTGDAPGELLAVCLGVEE